MMTITQMKTLNQDRGRHFFDANTMKFFNSKVETTADDNGNFITSEQREENTHTPRLYTVRHIDAETGDVETVGEFQQYATLDEAKNARKEL